MYVQYSTGHYSTVQYLTVIERYKNSTYNENVHVTVQQYEKHCLDYCSKNRQKAQLLSVLIYTIHHTTRLHVAKYMSSSLCVCLHVLLVAVFCAEPKWPLNDNASQKLSLGSCNDIYGRREP